MVQKCKNCGAKIIKFPIWKGQEKGEPFDWNKLTWMNLFKVDLMTIIWLAVVIFIVISYKADIKQCEEIITDPLKYCEESNACKIIGEREDMNPYGLIDLEEIPELNLSG